MLAEIGGNGLRDEGAPLSLLRELVEQSQGLLWEGNVDPFSDKGA